MHGEVGLSGGRRADRVQRSHRDGFAYTMVNGKERVFLARKPLIQIHLWKDGRVWLPLWHEGNDKGRSQNSLTALERRFGKNRSVGTRNPSQNASLLSVSERSGCFKSSGLV